MDAFVIRLQEGRCRLVVEGVGVLGILHKGGDNTHPARVKVCHLTQISDFMSSTLNTYKKFWGYIH